MLRVLGLKDLKALPTLGLTLSPYLKLPYSQAS